MRAITILAVLVMLAACSPEPASSDHSAVTYYDRNNDGVADFEFHEPGCDDCDWALVDIDFDGRYEKRVTWAYALVTEAVDVPVPTDAVLKVGQPPMSGWAE